MSSNVIRLQGAPYQSGIVKKVRRNSALRFSSPPQSPPQSHDMSLEQCREIQQFMNRREHVKSAETPHLDKTQKYFSRSCGQLGELK